MGKPEKERRSRMGVGPSASDDPSAWRPSQAGEEHKSAPARQPEKTAHENDASQASGTASGQETDSERAARTGNRKKEARSILGIGPGASKDASAWRPSKAFKSGDKGPGSLWSPEDAAEPKTKGVQVPAPKGGSEHAARGGSDGEERERKAGESSGSRWAEARAEETGPRVAGDAEQASESESGAAQASEFAEGASEGAREKESAWRPSRASRERLRSLAPVRGQRRFALPRGLRVGITFALLACAVYFVLRIWMTPDAGSFRPALLIFIAAMVLVVIVASAAGRRRKKRSDDKSTLKL